MNNFLKQEKLLNEILEELEKHTDPSVETSVEKNLSELKDSLMKDQNFRFYMCADLNKVQNLLNGRILESIWLDLFPATFKYNNNFIFVSNQPFKVDFTWTLKKKPVEKSSPNRLQLSPNSPSNNGPRINTPATKKDFIINLGSTESSFLHIMSSIDIDSYSHPNYAALLVLIEYFTQTEVLLII